MFTLVETRGLSSCCCEVPAGKLSAFLFLCAGPIRDLGEARSASKLAVNQCERKFHSLRFQTQVIKESWIYFGCENCLPFKKDSSFDLRPELMLSEEQLRRPQLQGASVGLHSLWQST